MVLALTSAKLPSSARDPMCDPGRRCENGPMRTSSSTPDDSSTLAQIMQRSRPPSRTAGSRGDAVSRPTRVRPRSTTFGSRVTSSRELHGRVEPGARRIDDGHARTLVRSFMAPRMPASAHASWTRSLTPMSVPSSGMRSAATTPRRRAARGPRAAAGSTRRSPARPRWPSRRRSHAASKAYSPALISPMASSAGVASFASTTRSRPPPRRARRGPGRRARRRPR